MVDAPTKAVPEWPFPTGNPAKAFLAISVMQPSVGQISSKGGATFPSTARGPTVPPSLEPRLSEVPVSGDDQQTLRQVDEVDSGHRTFLFASKPPQRETSRIDKIKIELSSARIREGLGENVISVCVGADNPGLSLKDRDGQYRGLEVDVAKLVVGELGDAINQMLEVVFVSPSLGDRLQHLETKRCVFMADLLTNIPERREVVSFTSPYLVIHEELLAFRSANITFPNCKVLAVAAGSATEVRYKEKFPEIRQVLTESNGDGLELLLNGTVDCMANDNIVFKELLEKIDQGTYRGAYPELKSSDLERISTNNAFPLKPWGLGVANDTPWLLKELTAIMIYAAADGRLDALRQEHGFGDGGFSLEPGKCSL